MTNTVAQAPAAGWVVLEGAYRGTPGYSHDCIGRWYPVPLRADLIDKTGPGYPTRRAALEAIAQRLATSED